MEEIDHLIFLRPDYLNLMLMYQFVEDYLFQAVYRYLRFDHGKGKDELQYFKTKSLKELKDFFFTTYEVRSLSLEEKRNLSTQFQLTIDNRNYYAHQFFSDLYFNAYDETAKRFKKKPLRELDTNLMIEKDRLQEFYGFLKEKFGPHRAVALRNFKMSDKSASSTYAELSPELRTPAYAKQREEAFAIVYWNLAYGYFGIEASLYAIVDRLDKKYHFLDEANRRTLQNKSMNEYRKLLTIAVKKDPFIHMLIDDCVPSLTTFLQNILALQKDRNYWLHFCLADVIKDMQDFDFSSFCQNVENYNKASKSLVFQEKTKRAIFALEDLLARKVS